MCTSWYCTVVKQCSDLLFTASLSSFSEVEADTSATASPSVHKPATRRECGVNLPLIDYTPAFSTMVAHYEVHVPIPPQEGNMHL